MSQTKNVPQLDLRGEICPYPMMLTNKELDEKIMLGLRLKEGVDLKEVFKEQNWENKKFESNFSKLVEEWERFLESGLLVRKGNRFFLSEPNGMALSNQVLVSMFKWWDEIN